MIRKPQGPCNNPPPPKRHRKETYRERLQAEISGSADNTETNVTERNNETYQRFLTNDLKQIQKF